jgi:hypothetical protein
VVGWVCGCGCGCGCVGVWVLCIFLKLDDRRGGKRACEK